MIQPAKWWIGLPLLAILFVIAATLKSETIERDIGDRARAALARDAGALDDARIAVAGRDVSVSGVALSREATARLIENVRSQPGVRVAIDATADPPFARPFVFRLERRGDKLALSGAAPTTGERDRIRAAAASRGFKVADTASYAAGAPKNFEALAEFALAALAELDEGKAAISDATLAIGGATKSFDAYDRALAALKSPPAGADLRSAELTPPPAAPFVWSAAREGDAFTLSGFVPSLDIRDFLAARAAAAGAIELSDATRVASGGPTGDFAGAASAALAQLARLERGKVVLADARLSIEGAGKKNVAQDAVESGARAALPTGFDLERTAVAAGFFSPYAFSARKEGGTLTLAGYAPDEAARAAIVERARRNFDGKIVDELVPAKGEPEGFVGAAIASLRALARLSSGSVALSDLGVTLEGTAFHAQAPRDIEWRLQNDLPNGFKSAARLGVEPAAVAIEPGKLFGALSEIAAKGIRFGGDDSSIDAESLPVLDALAFALLRSPDAAIEIAGHTDNAGAEADSEAVSRRRAQTVLDYLVKAGVDPARLTAAGFGGSRPIAANDDESGRALNRRIEFSIK